MSEVAALTYYLKRQCGNVRPFCESCQNTFKANGCSSACISGPTTLCVGPGGSLSSTCGTACGNPLSVVLKNFRLDMTVDNGRFLQGPPSPVTTWDQLTSLYNGDWVLNPLINPVGPSGCAWGVELPTYYRDTQPGDPPNFGVCGGEPMRMRRVVTAGITVSLAVDFPYPGTFTWSYFWGGGESLYALDYDYLGPTICHRPGDLLFSFFEFNEGRSQIMFNLPTASPDIIAFDGWPISTPCGGEFSLPGWNGVLDGASLLVTENP